MALSRVWRQHPQGVPSRSKTCFLVCFDFAFSRGVNEEEEEEDNTMVMEDQEEAKSTQAGRRGPACREAAFFLCVFLLLCFLRMLVCNFFALSTVSHIFEYMYTRGVFIQLDFPSFSRKLRRLSVVFPPVLPARRGAPEILAPVLFFFFVFPALSHC